MNPVVLLDLIEQDFVSTRCPRVVVRLLKRQEPLPPFLSALSRGGFLSQETCNQARTEYWQTIVDPAA
jgi:hypothetical protein